jgi:hypothetical protein
LGCPVSNGHNISWLLELSRYPIHTYDSTPPM